MRTNTSTSTPWPAARAFRPAANGALDPSENGGRGHGANGEPSGALLAILLLLVASLNAFNWGTTTGTVTIDGLYTVVVFNTSGSLNITGPAVNATVLAVAGAGGGRSGGGGGGGVNFTIGVNNSNLIGNTTVTVGQGGAGATVDLVTDAGGANGTNSSFGALVIARGGGGGGNTGNGQPGGAWAGGSGGGAGSSSDANVPGGSGTAGQGWNGGSNGVAIAPGYPAAGGGGCAANATNATGTSASDGAIGCSFNITNWSAANLTYGAGGGGGCFQITCFPGVGGSNIGGNGSLAGSGTGGINGTGSGGGGTGNTQTAGRGGDGIVVVRFLTPPNATLAIVNNIAAFNASAAHWFTINATVNDSVNGTNISSATANSTFGTCAQISNSTAGLNFTATFNCTSATPGQTQLFIQFLDATNGVGINTSFINNSYPDHNASLTMPSITPANPTIVSTLTCNPGTFTDPDSDTENVSARIWAWFKNGAVIGGQTANTLGPSNFGAGDSIICQQFATNSTWPTSNGTNNSSAVVIQDIVGIASNITFTNASAGHWFYANATGNDTAGGAGINVVSATSTVGSCTQFSNATSGNNFSVVFNCSSAVPGTATVVITFNDTAQGDSANTSGSNTYPDRNSSLTAPSISPVLATSSSNLTCNNGTFSDPDGDTENISARSWAWFVNGANIGINNQTLLFGNFSANDLVICREFATNSTWTTSNGTTNSSAVNITLDITGLQVILLSPANGSTVNTIPQNLTWQNITSNDTFYGITYMLCYNASQNINQTCVVAITGTSYNLSNPTGAIVLWQVVAQKGAVNSQYSATWIYVVSSPAVLPPLVGPVDLDTVFTNFWLLVGELFVCVLAAGIAHLVVPQNWPLSTSGFVYGVMLVFASILFAVGGVPSGTLGALAALVIILSAVIRAAGR